MQMIYYLELVIILIQNDFLFDLFVCGKKNARVYAGGNRNIIPQQVF